MSDIYSRLNETRKVKEPKKQISDTKPDTNVGRLVDTTVSSNTGAPHEVIRKAVLFAGKETASLRLSTEEKEALQAIVHELRKRRYMTNETEVIRISLNQVLVDYADNADNSVLMQVMERLYR